MKGVKIRSVGTAVPPHALCQKDIKKTAAALFNSHIQHLDRLLPVFENSLIQTRYLSQPLAWYSDIHPFAEANRIYEEVALALAEQASRQAIDRAGIAERDVGMVVFVSSTGIATPTLDAKLIQRLGLSPHTYRLPVWGLGCAGGVAGLARAAELAKNYTRSAVLLVTVELCSLTFQRNDFSKANLIGTSIFADGAAAAIIAAEGNGPEVLGSYSTLFPNSEDIMGWELIDTGLKVRFSRDIPSIVRKELPALVAQACDLWGITHTDIQHYVVHPGGAKVLQAYTECFGLHNNDLVSGYEVLANYGNMSSSSVFFVLERFLASTPPANEYGIMLSLGPGFSAEQVLFRW
ncbi:type III polyketide synthase [Sporomusa acidovorans]|uniref:1,3,6,8-tetrahydroxynaphthalene synthase n=1 Tax=Sporomusa acidovorans (strain ATCC 49682 / DSM 3132 / Mol) TaxID=1123286 RepID=A0ABZ3IYP7_SPOA4|nr:3-oxoacyl-[acyl-carrier-protein] synthase III C-terminal domain-containing protein [Sporomusa acidovorans]OZC16855.1 alpha-pyrone synthesis polyketide synthase-like Pks11 [Sporomusa acidovorans DSM 3132]SDF24459.1 alkylresorcinol/alkylpyrone synthase [Sporomusa acidovorans]